MRRFGSYLALAAGLLGAAPLAAQGGTGTVRGRVVDDGQRPLQGVTVSVAGKTVLSSASGRFVLTEVPAGPQAVKARRLGFAPVSQDVTLLAGQTLDLELVMTIQEVQLAEIVTTGYGEQTAGSVTGAVSQVSTEEFNKGRIVSPAELIAAKVPGVQIVDNNEPGGGLAIRIRGATSINASSEPLIVIDGMPIGTSNGGGTSAGRDALNFLNPNEIETITVLRDASAAAIYGANGANGVVLVTTKAGKARQAPQVEYTVTTSASEVTRLPTMLNADQFRAAVTTFAPNNAAQLRNENTNWFGQVGRTAFGQEHTLAVSGSSDRTTYRLSLNYLNQDGVIQPAGVERIGIGINLSQRLLNDRLNVKLNLRGARNSDQFLPGGLLGNTAQMGPTQPVFDAAGVGGFYDWPGNALTSPDNPVAISQLAVDRGITFRGFGNVQAQYSVPGIEGLTANANLGFDVTDVDRATFDPSTLHAQRKTGNGGSTTRRNQSLVNAVVETYLTYNAPGKVGPGALELTGGYSYTRSSSNELRLEANGLATDFLGINGVPAARVAQNFQDIQESKLISFFGRANYNIDDKYLLAFSLRRDGSSRFGPANAWGMFPSASLGWRLSEESFLKGGAFSDLKLRASWARTGNQAFANYQQYVAFLPSDQGTSYFFNGQFIPTIRPNAVDPNIKWEATRTVNVGLDFAFKGLPVTGTIDVYDKETSDLIFTVPVAAGTNLSNFVTTNIGSMRNRGVELGLSIRALEGRNGGLGWTADFNAARNQNELLSINPAAVGAAAQRILTGEVAGGVGTTIQVLQPGSPVNSFFVYQTRRGPDGLPIRVNNPAGANVASDSALYVDQNGDNRINVDDRRAFRDPAPRWIIGHSSYLTYRKFDLGFTLRAWLGNYVYNNVASNLGTYAEVGRASPYNLHTSVLQTGFAGPQYLSDFYVEDGSFLRMDNLTLGYSFDLNRKPARFFITAQNVFTITGYSGVDPTAGLRGIDNNIFPRARTFTGGLSLRL
ncbi:MAG: SusC/RagA family TonB-linked outer membrane protein [Gemmatimonadales bacterium]|nr:SusC/RagA family TonB-linked outer membrane protein [Gemmatimonadales bacterium]